MANKSKTKRILSLENLRNVSKKIQSLIIFPKSKKKGRKIKTAKLMPQSLNFVWKKYYEEIQPYHMPSLIKSPEMSVVIWEIQKAFDLGIAPERNKEGTSESYLLKDQNGDYISIFKPYSSGIKDAARELAAYRLDHDHFAGVPPTVQTILDHPIIGGKKAGVLQLYMNGIPLVYVNTIPHPQLFSSQIRRIAMLDIRILNPDRHTSNLLFIPKTRKLIPIDHGASLTTTPFVANFAWLSWEQASMPFSKKECNYAEAIDPVKDAYMLQNEVQIEDNNIACYIIATHFLKEGIRRKFLAADIGKMVLREPRKKFDEKYSFPSSLEKIYIKLKDKSFLGWKAFDKIVHKEVCRRLDHETY